jgi:LysR family transcriptional regulator, glycine cleavage system transcriptional activator
MQNLNRVHLNGLRAVEAAARLGSLQTAAEELGVTPGAISQQIAKTEAQLGITLFERRPKGLVPTAVALPVIERLTEGFQKLADAVAATRRRESNCLTISVAPVFAARWLVRRMDSFAREFPEIVLRIDATTQLVDPATSDVDLAIRVGEGVWPGVKAELILAQEIFPVVAPELARKLKRPEDILEVPAVIDSRAMFNWSLWLEAAGLGDKNIVSRHIFNDASLCLDATIAGQGAMLAWQTLAADAVAEGRLVVSFPIKAKTGKGHYFISDPQRRESRNIQLFKSWLRKELEASMSGLSKEFQVPAL